MNYFLLPKYRTKILYNNRNVYNMIIYSLFIKQTVK